ncbi:hypothetical protein M0804_009040 [Polistes exclamans]|nr:hypothetical protein M0804_009040 [Polistes exclamans]
MIEDQAVDDSDIINSLIDYENGREELESITADKIYEGIQISKKLETYFFKIDTNAERCLIFQKELRSCMSHYRDVYKQLTSRPSSQKLITNFMEYFLRRVLTALANLFPYIIPHFKELVNVVVSQGVPLQATGSKFGYESVATKPSSNKEPGRSAAEPLELHIIENYTLSLHCEICWECLKTKDLFGYGMQNIKFYVFTIYNSSNNDEEKNKLTEEHDVHLRLAESARNSLKQAQEQVSRNSDYFAFSFDLQKALPYPKLTTAVAYYKRNMYILNFGIHNFHNDNVYMYVWDETIASRGAQEVVSCILKHIKNLRSEKHIITYSDMCTGQNRNIKVALMWLKIVQTLDNNVEIIDHKFLISGHSFLPNDRDSGVIIKKCRKGNNFIVNEIRQEDFVPTKLLEDAIFKRVKNSDGELVNWLRICWMRFVRNEPYKIFHKTSMNENENFKVLNLLPRRGRPRKFENILLTPLYKNIRQITTAKFKDIIDLLRYISPEPS